MKATRAVVRKKLSWLFYFWRRRHDTENRLDCGVIYSVSEDFDLDCGTKAGLTRAEADYGLLAGLTYRF
jgi:hypothetical protein